jgi:hypothetical protein
VIRLKGLGPAAREATPRIMNRPVMHYIDGLDEHFASWWWRCPDCPPGWFTASANTYVRALLTARGHLIEKHFDGEMWP